MKATKKTKQMIKTIFPASREEWLAERRKGLGSSEVGAVLGVNKYCTPYEVWLSKTGQAPPKAETLAMTLGHLLEGAVAELFSREAGVAIDDRTAGDFIVINDAEPFARASPDRLGKAADGTRVVVECKTTAMRVDEDALPLPWYCQVQYLLFCTGLTRGAVAWLSQGRDFGYRWFDADADFAAYMLGDLREFWSKCVLGGEAPPPVSPADAAARYPRGGGGGVEATAGVVKAVERLREARARVKALEEEAEAAETEVKAFLGDREVLTVDGETVATWKATKARETFDSAAFRRADPETFAKFVKPVAPSRRFLLK